MIQLRNMHNSDKMVQLADAFGLRPVESDDDITVYFYIVGMTDHILTADSIGRVTTYSGISSSAATFFREDRDLCDMFYCYPEVFQSVINILIGTYETYMRESNEIIDCYRQR